jgi:hypothetical protein
MQRMLFHWVLNGVPRKELERIVFNAVIVISAYSWIRLINEFLPDKVRRILGTVLLSIGVIGCLFGWLLSMESDGNDPWGGLAVIVIVLPSIMVGFIGVVFLSSKLTE